MQLAVRGLVLDMDGTMLDTEPLYKRAWQGASAELGYPLSDVAALLDEVRSAGGQVHLLLFQRAPFA